MTASKSLLDHDGRKARSLSPAFPPARWWTEQSATSALASLMRVDVLIVFLLVARCPLASSRRVVASLAPPRRPARQSAHTAAKVDRVVVDVVKAFRRRRGKARRFQLGASKFQHLLALHAHQLMMPVGPRVEAHRGPRGCRSSPRARDAPRTRERGTRPCATTPRAKRRRTSPMLFVRRRMVPYGPRGASRITRRCKPSTRGRSAATERFESVDFRGGGSEAVLFQLVFNTKLGTAANTPGPAATASAVGLLSGAASREPANARSAV